MDSTFVSAWNNLGNIKFMEGNFLKAESLYNHALQVNPCSSGTNLNLAILYKMMIKWYPEDSIYYQQKCGQVMKKAAQPLDGKIENAYSMLGFENEELLEKQIYF